MLLRLAVGATFVYASFYKIVDPAAFARSIWYYHLVPGSLINLMALVLPWVELLAGVLLAVGCHYRGAVLLVNAMTMVFIGALLSAIARGINIDCGCFKAAQASSESALNALWFDLVLVLATLWLWLSRSTKWQLDRCSNR
jgi:uncharacterized membrane protein YphA (DoxX/SURF4 family)